MEKSSENPPLPKSQNLRSFYNRFKNFLKQYIPLPVKNPPKPEVGPLIDNNSLYNSPPTPIDTKAHDDAKNIEEYTYLNNTLGQLNNLLGEFSYGKPESLEVIKNNIQASYREYLLLWSKNFISLLADEEWINNHQIIYNRQKLGIKNTKDEINIVEEFTRKTARQKLFQEILGKNQKQDWIIVFSKVRDIGEKITSTSPANYEKYMGSALEKYKPLVEIFINNLNLLKLREKMTEKGQILKNSFKHFDRRRPSDRNYLLQLAKDLQIIINNTNAFIKINNLMKEYFVFQKAVTPEEMLESLNFFKKQVEEDLSPGNLEEVLQKDSQNLTENNNLLCMHLTKEEINKITLLKYETKMKKIIASIINNSDKLQTLYLDTLQQSTVYKIKQKTKQIKLLKEEYQEDIKKYGSRYTDTYKDNKKKQMLAAIDSRQGELEVLNKIPPLIKEIKTELLFSKYYTGKISL